MNIQDLLYFTVRAGFNLEKNRVSLTHIKGIIPRYQVWSNRKENTETKVYTEIDPAVERFIELSQ